MAVIADTPEQEEGTEPVTVPKSTFAQILSRQIRFRGRQFFRAIIIPIRSLFFLEEDSMRDQMILGLRADVDYLAQRLAGAMSGVNALDERLAAHEEAIPRMRAIKAQLDNTKRIEKAERDAKIKAAVKAEEERLERLESGVLV